MSLLCIFVKQLAVFCAGHKNWVLSIAWSPDGKHLVSGSKAGELLTWDPLTGKPSGNPLVVRTSLSICKSYPLLIFLFYSSINFCTGLLSVQFIPWWNVLACSCDLYWPREHIHSLMQ